MCTGEERDYMYYAYARDPPDAPEYRHRPSSGPLLDNDRRKVELLNSIVFTLPGSPIIYYGDEIGMGDNIHLGDRNGVRTPMHWTADRNAGFSKADPSQLFLPVVADAVYGYQSVNIEAQKQATHSLLNWMRRMIAIRKKHKVFGRGTLEFLSPSNEKILAYIRAYEQQTVLLVHNLAESSQAVELDLGRYKDIIPEELFGESRFPVISERPYVLTLGPYSSYWLHLPGRPVTDQRIQHGMECHLIRSRRFMGDSGAGSMAVNSALDEYREVSPKGTVDFLYRLSDLVKGKSFLHLNAVRYGGGMSEVLRRLVPMMVSLGVHARWEVLAGTQEYFVVVNRMLNALQGRDEKSPTICTTPIRPSSNATPRR